MKIILWARVSKPGNILTTGFQIYPLLFTLPHLATHRRPHQPRQRHHVIHILPDHPPPLAEAASCAHCGFKSQCATLKARAFDESHRLFRRHVSPQEKEMLQREIKSTDQAIDTLVYQLYGLTEAEIKIVEGR